MFTTKYQVTRSFLRLGIIITGLLSAIIGILAFFGQNMGTFVISLDNNVYSASIILSDNKEFTSASPRLLVRPITDTWPVAFNDLKIEDIKNTDGDFTDPDNLTYIGYTFYLKNEGTSIVDIEFNISILSITLGLDKCIRLMLIEDDVKETIYMASDSAPKDPLDYTPDELCQDFLSDSYVCKSQIESFRPNEVKKFSIIIWLEGWDADCTNDKMGGQMRMEMVFSIIKSMEEEK